MDATRCSNLANCQDGEKCLTHHLWCDLSAQIHNFLSSITLASLIDREEIQSTAKRQLKYQLERIEADTQTAQIIHRQHYHLRSNAVFTVTYPYTPLLRLRRHH